MDWESGPKTLVEEKDPDLLRFYAGSEFAASSSRINYKNEGKMQVSIFMVYRKKG
jgi:hypothetical protein